MIYCRTNYIQAIKGKLRFNAGDQTVRMPVRIILLLTSTGHL